MELRLKYEKIHIVINVIKKNGFGKRIETARGRGVC